MNLMLMNLLQMGLFPHASVVIELFAIEPVEDEFDVDVDALVSLFSLPRDIGAGLWQVGFWSSRQVGFQLVQQMDLCPVQ